MPACRANSCLPAAQRSCLQPLRRAAPGMPSVPQQWPGLGRIPAQPPCSSSASGRILCCPAGLLRHPERHCGQHPARPPDAALLRYTDQERQRPGPPVPQGAARQRMAACTHGASLRCIPVLPRRCTRLACLGRPTPAGACWVLAVPPFWNSDPTCPEQEWQQTKPSSSPAPSFAAAGSRVHFRACRGVHPYAPQAAAGGAAAPGL